MIKTEKFIQDYKHDYGEKYADEAAVARAVYQKAVQTESGHVCDFCIMGKLGDITSICSAENLEQENGKLIGNFAVTNSEQSGIVLREDKWTIGVNDAWVMGAAEGQKLFYMVKDGGFAKFDDIYLLSGNAAHPVTVTARELIGLMAFGYIPSLVQGVLIFRPAKKFTDISFSLYQTTIYNFMPSDDKDGSRVKENLRNWFVQNKVF
ncbi:MAG TPA: hypothetical protein DCL73_10585 [Treponema sp.]|nr:hypothetical protein [Treponema sp.]